EITLFPKDENDRESYRVREEYNLLTHSQLGYDLIGGNARGYLLEGNLTEQQIERLLEALLVDVLTEKGFCKKLGAADGEPEPGAVATVLLKPGVMDPVAQSVIEAARDLDIPLDSVSTFRRYFLSPDRLPQADRDILYRKVLANDAIEQVIEGPLSLDHLTLG